MNYEGLENMEAMSLWLAEVRMQNRDIKFGALNTRRAALVNLYTDFGEVHPCR